MTEHDEAAGSRRPRRRFVAGCLGIFLFGGGLVGAVATRWLEARAEHRFPVLGRFVEVQGTRQHVLDQGEGRPIVFVHGAFGGLQDFAATILPLASQRFRCIAWDRPGHGYSERPTARMDPGQQADLLLALLERLELEQPPLLVGFSYGGAVVLAAGVRAPERLHGILLLNGPSHPWPDPLDWSYRFPALPLLGPLLTETLATPVGHLLASASVAEAFAPAAVHPAFEESPVPLALRPASYRANASDVRTLKPFLAGQVEAYPGLALPVTMVVAEGDQIVSPTIHSQQLERASERVRVLRVPDAGHQILYSHTDLVLDLVAEARE